MHELLIQENWLAAFAFGIGSIYFGYLATADGMILSQLKAITTRFSCWVWRKEALKAIEEDASLDSIGWLRKIVWACPYCMANPFTWGGLAYGASVYKGFLEFDVLTWIIYCVFLSGLIKFIDVTADRMGASFDIG